jgi:hypothetical protein
MPPARFTPYRHFPRRRLAIERHARRSTRHQHTFWPLQGGLASDEKGRTLIRRWTSPFDGRISLRSLFEQRFDNGCRKCDGLPARIQSPAAPAALLRGPASRASIETRLRRASGSLAARRSTSLSRCPARRSSSGAVTIRRLDGPAEEWDSVRDFRHPAAGRLTAWERYARGSAGLGGVYDDRLRWRRRRMRHDATSDDQIRTDLPLRAANCSTPAEWALALSPSAPSPATDTRADEKPYVNPLAPKPPHFAPRAKRVIHLFMNGGPSQVDTFDPKPMLDKYDGKPLPIHLKTERKTGVGFASPWKFQKHGQSGIEVSELYPTRRAPRR